MFYSRDLLSAAAVMHLKRPLIYEVHGIAPPGSWRRRLLGWLVAQPNLVRVVSITTTLRALYLTAFPRLPVDRVIVAASGAAEIIPAAHRVDWIDSRNRFQVGFVGRPYRGKGIETLIDAATALSDMDFHIVGAEASDVAWLKIDALPNVHFHGYRTQTELGAYYERFDVVVAPYGAQVDNASGVESANVLSSLKVVEYMASGVPLVASDLPGVSEVVTDGVSALLVPPGNLAAFTAALQRLRDDPALGKRLSKQAHEDMRRLYSWDARVGTVLGNMPKGRVTGSS